MNLKQRVALTVLLFFSVSNSIASPFKYDFIEAQILKPDSDVLDNGFGIEASYALVPNYNINASYQRREGGNKVFKRSSDKYSVGVGYHTALNGVTDFTSRLYYLHDETSTYVKANDVTLKNKNTGGGIQVGLRRVLGKDIDGTLNVGVRHLHGVEDASVGLGVEYHMSDTLSLGATYTFDTQINAGAVKVRYEF